MYEDEFSIRAAAMAAEGEPGTSRHFMVVLSGSDGDLAGIFSAILMDAGHSASFFNRPDAALGAIRAFPSKFDGIILRIEQAGVDGITLLEQLRTESQLPLPANIRSTRPVKYLTDDERAGIARLSTVAPTVFGVDPFDIEEIYDFASSVDVFWREQRQRNGRGNLPGQSLEAVKYSTFLLIYPVTAPSPEERN